MGYDFSWNPNQGWVKSEIFPGLESKNFFEELQNLKFPSVQFLSKIPKDPSLFQAVTIQLFNEIIEYI